ncbi:MAG: hypothetical protein LBH01_01985 [Verrucomicrobiales bacterium]|jgi:hypothetical protein|nr:hypothetical protein [Verrucomicrobiales bacterium]
MNLQKRGKNGFYYVRFQWQGKDIWRSTKCTTQSLALTTAKTIYRAVISGRAEALNKTKIKSPYPTLGQITKIYKDKAPARSRTKTNNINALRNVCFLVLGKELSDLKTDVLTADLVRNYQTKKIESAKTETKKASAEVSANSSLRQAKSIFAKKVMYLYNDFTLPDLSGFMQSPCVTDTKIHGFVPFPFAKWFGFCRTVYKLKSSDVSAWRLFIMMSKLGMSNREAYFAEESWIEKRGNSYVMSIKIRDNFKPKSKNRIRDIPISSKIADYLLEKAHPLATHIAPDGKFAAIRLNKIFRHYFPDRQKAIYELRKHAGSLVATRDNILSAAKFLGDRNETAEKYYVALLKPIKPL